MSDLTGDHLEEASARGIELVETNSGSQCSVESAEDEGDDDEHRQCPPWHTGVSSIVC